MSSQDIATALLRKALDQKGISYWPNKESLHNADLFDSVVYSVEDYNKLFPERLNPETFIDWVNDKQGVINVVGSMEQIQAALNLLVEVNIFLNKHESD